MECKAVPVKEILKDFQAENIYESEKLEFEGTEGMDVYNITSPIFDNGEYIIAGRVERRESEISGVKFFKVNGKRCILASGFPTFENLQDPFYARVGDEIVFGGVKIFTNDNDPEKIINYKTFFYRGKSLKDLKYFACGPDRMKDIRIVGLDDKRICLFSRPQGAIGGRGTIGYSIINDLDELNADSINSGQLLKNQFVPEEWGGTNQLHVLKNGKIGILGHIAYMSCGECRHYYSMTFCFDPISGEASPIKIIAMRKCLKPGESKRNDLEDVVFSGGLIRNGDGTSLLYMGAGDAEAHVLKIKDPFVQYE